MLIYLVSGWEGVVEAWPLAIVGSLSYIVGLWPVAHYLGPYLPDLSGALVCFWGLFLFVKIWRPKTIRGFGGAPLESAPAADGRQYCGNKVCARSLFRLDAVHRAHSGRCRLDGSMVHSSCNQPVQAIRRGKIVGDAQSHFIDI